MPAFELVSPFQPAGDQPQAIEASGRRSSPGPVEPDADGRHRLGQDVHDGERDRPVRPPRPGDVAQQDAGRPALRGIQGVLPPERRPLLRQLLRLLPARGLHPPARHLHRERRGGQRRDRAASSGLHERARQPGRRSGRGERLVHLRFGLARRLPQDDGAAAGRRSDRPRRGPLEVRRHPVRAQRRLVRAGEVPGARRRDRALAGLRGNRLPDRALRR